MRTKAGFLAVLFSVMLLLSSCSSPGERYLVYINVNSMHKATFKSSEKTKPVDCATEEYVRNDCRELTKKVPGTDIWVSYSYSTRSRFDDENLDYYESNDGYVAAFDRNGSLIKLNSKEFDKELFTHGFNVNSEDFMRFLNKKIEDVFLLRIYEYEKSYETLVGRKTGDSGSIGSEEGLLSDSVEEGISVYHYRIAFAKWQGKLRTDLIKCIIKPDGEIVGISRFPSGFSGSDIPAIDYEKIEESIHDSIMELYANKRIKDYTIRGYTLTKFEGKTVVVCPTEIIIENDDEGYADPIELMVVIP